jgi:uncharacterized coiled-coil DUF342 family protein
MEQMVFNWAVAIAGFCGGWILKIIWDAIQELKKDLRIIDTKMHEDFVRRDDFREAMNGVKADMVELKQDMKDGFTKLESMVNLIYKKIDSKADK